MIAAHTIMPRAIARAPILTIIPILPIQLPAAPLTIFHLIQFILQVTNIILRSLFAISPKKNYPDTTIGVALPMVPLLLPMRVTGPMTLAARPQGLFLLCDKIFDPFFHLPVPSLLYQLDQQL
jgi:hypothetical protein